MYGNKNIQEENLSVLTDDGEVNLIDRRPSGETIGELINRGRVNKLYVRDMQPNVSGSIKISPTWTIQRDSICEALL
jgi:hypothetical protein